MIIMLPKMSGFCYGVSLAVKAAGVALSSGKELFMYGEIVHNPTVNSDLVAKGGIIIDSIDKLPCRSDASRNAAVLIRAHGIPRCEYMKIKECGIEVIDMTCPKVRNVHNIVSDAESRGKRITVIGDPNHPEVVGIVGQCMGQVDVIQRVEDAEKLSNMSDRAVVSQTTFNTRCFEKISQILKDRSDDIEIYNTICPATELRQNEVSRLSGKADLTIVVGGKKSSNSRKLYEIASENCDCCMIESLEELDMKLLEGKEKLLLCGGSSTPFELISDIAKELCAQNCNNKIEYC